ncbi:hypothetical protein B566_EDAN011605 [Ephemera danica]|nr:hypothetical protein B566_EDAN011605 [Ephemera danica]
MKRYFYLQVVASVLCVTTALRLPRDAQSWRREDEMNHRGYSMPRDETWHGGIPEPAHMPARGREPHDMTVRYEEAVLNDAHTPETPNRVQPSFFTWNTDDPHFYDGKKRPAKKKEMDTKATMKPTMMTPWRDPMQEDYNNYPMPD